MGLVKEFREFALKGNVLDLAVGVIIGAAFGKIVNSMVSDILMPPLGLVTSGVDFSSWKFTLKSGVAEAKDAAGKVITAATPEVAISIGKFINIIIEFTIVAFCVFLVIKAFNTARKRFEKEQAAAAPPPPPPPGPTKDQQLLTEIRDLLAKRA